MIVLNISRKPRVAMIHLLISLAGLIQASSIGIRQFNTVFYSGSVDPHTGQPIEDTDPYRINYMGDDTDLSADVRSKIIKITDMIDYVSQGDGFIRTRIYDILTRRIQANFNGATIENIKDFEVFKLDIDDQCYIIKRVKASCSGEMLVTKINSPNIVKVHFAFIRPGTYQEWQWLVTEYLDVNVRNMIADAAITLRCMRRLLYDVICGLVDAHKMGCLHNDLHTGNVMGFTDRATGKIAGFKLIDFGLGEMFNRALTPNEIRMDIESISHFIERYLKYKCARIRGMGLGRCIQTICGSKSEVKIQAPVGLSSLIDLFFISILDCEYPPTSADELLNHAFIRNEELDVTADRFGKRHYAILESNN